MAISETLMEAAFHPILCVAAVVPALWLLIKVYRADRLEPEPVGLILSLILMGVISTALALLTETVGVWLLDRFLSPYSTLYGVLCYFVVVALSEEGFKYLLLKKRTWNSTHFNCQFDGVVYAVSVSLGFALWENLRYVLAYGLGAAAVRAVTAVPGHACFGVFMGVWYGAAKRHELGWRAAASKSSRTLAVVVPTLLHGAYDYIALTQGDAISWVFLAFVVLLFLAALRVVKGASENDSYIA